MERKNAFLRRKAIKVIDPVFVQLAETNIELRDESNREIEINRTNEKNIRRLIRDLENAKVS